MDWNYIAGFFDGEGSVILHVVNKNRTRCTLTVTNTHYKSLDTMKRFTGIGNIYKTKKQRSYYKKAWVWCISKKTDVLLMIKRIKFRCIIKKYALIRAEKVIRCQKHKITYNDTKIKKIILAEASRPVTLSHRDIAKKVGLTFMSVWRCMKKYGVYNTWKKHRTIRRRHGETLRQFHRRIESGQRL